MTYFSLRQARHWKAATLLSRSLIAFVLFFLVVGKAYCAPILDDHRKEDPRLDKTLTLSVRRQNVSDLLKELSEKTGVVVTASDADLAGSDLVTVSVKQDSLFNLLNDLWSLLSYKGGEWHWSRVKNGADYQYTLRRPLAAKNYLAKVHEEIQVDFEKHARELLDNVDTPKEEQGNLDDISRAYLESERLRSGLKLLSGAMSTSDLGRALKGEISPVFQVSSLSAKSREFIRNQWAAAKGSTRSPDGSTIPIPEPKSIDIHLSKDGELVPSLFIELDGIGGYAYFGGVMMENKWQKNLFDRWIHSGDLVDKGTSEAYVFPENNLRKAPKSSKYPLSDSLLEISDTFNISVVACVPDDESQYRAAKKGNLSVYLKDISDRQTKLWHKFRDGDLILTTVMKLLEEEESRLPNDIRAEVKKKHEACSGQFEVSDLIAIGAKLNQAQLRRLALDYSVMEHVANWNHVFKRISQSATLKKSIVTENGAILNDLAGALENQGVDLSGPVQQGAKRLRITSTDRDFSGILHRIVEIQMLADKGQIVYRSGFGMRKMPDPTQ